MIGTLLVKERVEPALLDMFRTAIIGPRIAVASSVSSVASTVVSCGPISIPMSSSG